MEPLRCANCRTLQRQVEDLKAENERLRGQLETARRAGKRQAGPFAKGAPKPNPKKPGRKPGKDYGTKAHREPPTPEQIDEVHEAPLPTACPDCGGPLDETHVAQQFQVEIPRKPLHRQFNIHVGQFRQCHRRVQGRLALQSSDALGAAAAQLGPDAQAAIVELNKQAGLSHGKVTGCLECLFGNPLSGAAVSGPCCGPPPVVNRPTPPSARMWARPTGSCLTKLAGAWAGTPPGCTRWSARKRPPTSSTPPVAVPWPRPSWGSIMTAR
jgi:transposase